MRVVWIFEYERPRRNDVCGKFGFVLITCMTVRFVQDENTSCDAWRVRCELITFYTEYGTSHVLRSLSLLGNHVSFKGRCWEFRPCTLVQSAFIAFEWKHRCKDLFSSEALVTVRWNNEPYIFRRSIFYSCCLNIADQVGYYWNRRVLLQEDTAARYLWTT